MNRIDRTGYFWDELGNWLSGNGWRESKEEEIEERNRNREAEREAELRNTYGKEEAERILEAEKNNPGFRFDSSDRKLTLENQIQLYLIEQNYK